MPSILAHAVADAALATAAFVPRPVRRRVWITGAVLAALPDVDAIGRPFVWQPLGEIGRGPRGPERAFDILANEVVWVGLPSLIVVAIARVLRNGST